MSIWAVTLGLAIVTVLVTRGSFFALARLRLRFLWLLVPAAAIQIGIGFVDFPEARITDVGFGLLMLSYALLLAFCSANLGLRGMGVVVIGIAMNTIVIGLNQGMPVTDDAWRDGEVVSEPFERTVKHKPESDDDRLGFLGDIILLPEPFAEAISFGDLVLAAGVVDVVFWGSRKKRRKTAEEEAEELEAAAAATSEIDDETEIEPVVIDLTEPEPESEPDITKLSPGSSNPTVPHEPAPIAWSPPPVSIELNAEPEPAQHSSDARHRDAAPFE